MPEFKLKKMFSKGKSPSQSPKHHKADSAVGDHGRGKKSDDNYSKKTASPEHALGPCVSSSGSGSRSSLTGSSFTFSGGGSKSNSLERQSQSTCSDGGISSMSSGTDDSGHSSMSSPLNLPMEQLHSFNAMYRVGQPQSTSSSYLLNLQGPPKSLQRHLYQNPVSSSQHGHAHFTPTSTLFTGSSVAHHTEGKKRDDVSLSSSPKSSPSRRIRKKMLSLGFGSQQDQPNFASGTYDSQNERSVDVLYPKSDSFMHDYDSVPEPHSLDKCEDMEFQSMHAGSISPEDYRNKVIFELQWQVAELHERCAQLHKDSDIARDRLGSSMHSVGTFWSPELKKERALRKEEASRCSMLYEQLVVGQAELKHQQAVLKMTALEKEGSTHTVTDKGSTPTAGCSADRDGLQEKKQMQEKEINKLRQTADELEKHLETQKQTLSARDASIKTLLSMIQAKGVSDGEKGRQSERDYLQAQAAVNANRISELEATLQAKDANLKKLQELKASTISKDVPKDGETSSSTSSPLGALIEAKDMQISSLEKQVVVLEDRLLRSQEDLTMANCHDLDLPDTFKGKHLQHEIQKVTDDLSRRERKLSSLQRHIEVSQCQHQETLQHITALKQQLGDKDKQSALLQTEVENLQEKIKNKDGTIERKRKENQTLVSDKQSLDSELSTLKDQLDSMENKVTILKKKAEMYDDVLKEKDEQLSRARSRQACTKTVESPVFSPEDALAERDRQIERLGQLQSQTDQDHEEELELYVMTSQDLKTQMAAMRFELTAKKAELRELRDDTTKLRSQKAQRDAKIKSLELVAEDVTSQPTAKEKVSIETQTDSVTPGSDMWSSTDESLTGALDWTLEAPTPAGPSLLEELQKKVSDMEEDKKEKEHQIEEMQDIIKEYRQKVGTLERNRQKEKKKNAQLLEAAKKREDSFSDDASHLSTEIDQKTSRIGELEEALRESVRITAQREIDMLELQAQIEASKSAMEEMRADVEVMRASSVDCTSKLATLSRQLDDKDGKIMHMKSQRHYHLLELYEIKMEALQAAVSEKVASIALLENTSTKKPLPQGQLQHLKLEKHRLQASLNDVTKSVAKMKKGRKWASGSTADCSATGVDDRRSVGVTKKIVKDGSTTI